MPKVGGALEKEKKENSSPLCPSISRIGDSERAPAGPSKSPIHHRVAAVTRHHISSPLYPRSRSKWGVRELRSK
jgi:hypothetical protein